MNRRTLVPGLVVVGLAITLAGGVAIAGPGINCDGEGGGLRGAPCRGTQRDDVITGSSRRDHVIARGGDDIVNGGFGADSISGGIGDDELNGGPNPDSLEGGPGNDTYDGGAGNDVMWDSGEQRNASDDVMVGGEGDDFLEDDSPGNDKLDGGPGNESFGYFFGMYGGPGDDELDGGPGDDVIAGEEGNDIIVGGEGDDFLDGVNPESPGSQDTISCGEGNDEVWANNNDTILDEANCETILRFDDATSAASPERRRAWEAQKERARVAFQNRRAGRR